MTSWSYPLYNTLSILNSPNFPLKAMIYIEITNFSHPQYPTFRIPNSLHSHSNPWIPLNLLTDHIPYMTLRITISHSSHSKLHARIRLVELGRFGADSSHTPFFYLTIFYKTLNLSATTYLNRWSLMDFDDKVNADCFLLKCSNYYPLRWYTRYLAHRGWVIRLCRRSLSG